MGPFFLCEKDEGMGQLLQDSYLLLRLKNLHLSFRSPPRDWIRGRASVSPGGSLRLGAPRGPLSIKMSQQERQVQESKASLVCGNGGLDDGKIPYGRIARVPGASRAKAFLT